MASNSGSRDLILERIRAGLRAPVVGSQEPAQGGMIFAPVENILERFQQECKANLMELTLTSDEQASAGQLVAVLDSLPEGEIFLQDSPVLRRLIERARTARLIRWSSEGAPREASQATVSL
ncbi:MAG TPA: hypothetical protein VLT16_02550, partial [Candidatus Limnocylindrales bacterium]|nr:hypothetical protein [Candidatus Limnocylindrales bacterium]